MRCAPPIPFGKMGAIAVKVLILRTKHYRIKGIELEARAGIEPANKGFADLCLTTWLPRPVCVAPPKAAQTRKRPRGFRGRLAGRDGAGDGTRTRDIDLGKVALYQLSYSRAPDLKVAGHEGECQAAER